MAGYEQQQIKWVPVPQSGAGGKPIIVSNQLQEWFMSDNIPDRALKLIFVLTVFRKYQYFVDGRPWCGKESNAGLH